MPSHRCVGPLLLLPLGIALLVHIAGASTNTNPSSIRLHSQGAAGTAFISYPTASSKHVITVCMSARERWMAPEHEGPRSSVGGAAGSASNMGMKRRHLGPTTEDIISFRRSADMLPLSFRLFSSPSGGSALSTLDQLHFSPLRSRTPLFLGAPTHHGPLVIYLFLM